MKTSTAKTQKEGLQHHIKKAASSAHSQLKTDAPLSEKDEVKQAEENMRKTRKKLL